MLDRVLDLQAQGKTMKQIAAELGVGYSTLYKHMDGEKPKAPKAPAVKEEPKSEPKTSADQRMLLAARIIKTMSASGFELIKMEFANVDSSTGLVVEVNNYE